VLGEDVRLVGQSAGEIALELFQAGVERYRVGTGAREQRARHQREQRPRLQGLESARGGSEVFKLLQACEGREREFCLRHT